jgi:2-polyprenyl-3-methyl-5-hydroxy-6-metoxy-1,4-benzoquinol methylase
MHCCRGVDYPAAERQFGPRVAERDIRNYQRKGPDRATRLLLTGLQESRLRAEKLLDIGGGVGVVSFELISRLALTRATLVEASPSYLDVARREAEKRGWSDRLYFVAGDFSGIAERIEPADVVAMHRVICCYPDYESLLRQALSHCRERFAFSYPRNRWYIRAWLAMDNLRRRIFGNSFSVFVHPPAAMHAIIREAGFDPVNQRATAVWSIEVYARPPSA